MESLLTTPLTNLEVSLLVLLGFALIGNAIVWTRYFRHRKS